jgi:hypothetical protein
MQRTNDSTYSIIAQYQTEYRGVVQYYRLAYNLHRTRSPQMGHATISGADIGQETED